MNSIEEISVVRKSEDHADVFIRELFAVFCYAAIHGQAEVRKSYWRHNHPDAESNVDFGKSKWPGCC